MVDWQSESPQLRAFLESLNRGDVLSGIVAAIERFGVFVALDDGPAHPVFPGVGFITVPELSWRRIGAAADVVEVGQRVSCEFLQFDTHNAESRLSLCGPDPGPARLPAVAQRQRPPPRHPGRPSRRERACAHSEKGVRRGWPRGSGRGPTRHCA
ncbi:S1 RNA-binding domain-containing protein [Kitasatospora sp. NPDC090091]|uniref:S1 RNA-binding domain-containing protein n=1 Tax=Kitasatospora sp. NPDC090091 TaxID=3364081 RepID=UPI00382EEA8A